LSLPLTSGEGTAAVDLEFLDRNTVYKAVWITPTILLASAQVFILSLMIFIDLGANINVAKSLASYIIWILVSQPGACYTMILIGMSFPKLGSTGILGYVVPWSHGVVALAILIISSFQIWMTYLFGYSSINSFIYVFSFLLPRMATILVLGTGLRDLYYGGSR
jgi:hypothetical protein